MLEMQRQAYERLRRTMVGLTLAALAVTALALAIVALVPVNW